MTPHRTGVRFPASPRSPNRPLSRMGCGGDYRFHSRGRTAVGFYHPAGRLTASPAGYFYAQLVGPVLPVRSGVYRRARGVGVERFGLTSKSMGWRRKKGLGVASKGPIYQDCQGPADRVCEEASYCADDMF